MWSGGYVAALPRKANLDDERAETVFWEGLTAYEFICQCSTTEPERFTFNPLPSNAGTEHLESGHASP
jgi:hypothetical protein